MKRDGQNEADGHSVTKNGNLRIVHRRSLPPVPSKRNCGARAIGCALTARESHPRAVISFSGLSVWGSSMRHLQLLLCNIWHPRTTSLGTLCLTQGFAKASDGAFPKVLKAQQRRVGCLALAGALALASTIAVAQEPEAAESVVQEPEQAEPE
jgi:hypothetical protein